MKDKLFIDSDIILDIALNRQPHFHSSALIVSSIEIKLFDGYTSSVIVSNIYYIIRKIESHKRAIDFISKLRLLIKVLPVDDEVIKKSLESNFKDFEDAIQYYTALSNHINYIITRNVRHYTRSEIHVHTPEQYIKMKEISGRADFTPDGA
jgi:predicted nucleic acid-binding protein